MTEDSTEGCHLCGDEATTTFGDGALCADCHAAVKGGSPRSDSGGDDDRNDSPHPRERVAERLREADLDVRRFIDVHDGGKASTDHTRHGPDGVTGNYGIYASGDEPGGLVDIDVDDYNDDVDDDALAAVNDLPETLAVETPHTSSDSPGHRFYAVKPGENFETASDALEAVTGNTKSATPTWGEVRVVNQYVVGPGSQLDGCDKEWCEECATSDGGYYRIAADRPIAAITADEFADVLRADPTVSGGNSASATRTGAEPRRTTLSDVDGDADSRESGDVGRDDEGEHPDPEDVVAATGVAEDYPRDDDRSEHDWVICKEFARHGVPREDAERWFFENLPSSKVVERGRIDYGETWSNAVTEVRREDGETGTTHVVPLPDHTGRRRDALVSVPRVDTEGLEDDELPVTPASIRAVAGLSEDDHIADLTDRQKAAAVWSLVGQSSEYHIRWRRDTNALWAFDADRGVWTNEGDRTLRHAARDALRPENYGKNVLAELQEQARADPEVETTADTFGLDPGYVTVENGVLDLHAAADGDGYEAIRPVRPEDYALVRLPVEYDPEADYEEWDTLVTEWAESGRADALQEYVGYCLHVGAFPIHRALLLVGSGANGKGTFLSVVRALLGRDNTTSIELQTLANEQNAVADFYGSVANIDDDLSARKLGAGLGMFKKLTAGDPVRGRHLYEDAFEFDPTGKHLYAANEVPEVNVPDDDEAFWRRGLLVEFPNHYPQSERDHDPRERLTEPDVLSGVLNWAIEGHARLLKQGYFTNEERHAHAKRRRWQAWGESAEQFISEHVEHDPDAPRRSTTDAHRIYAAWCRDRGERPVSQRQFTNKLKQEDVGYRQSVRIDGTPQRGYTALGFSGDVPAVEETPKRADPPASSADGESKQESLF